MSPRMVRMLKYLASHDGVRLEKANQTTLRGLALRGLVSRGGITGRGVEVLHEYQFAEFIKRKAEGLPLSPSVAAALKVVRIKSATNSKH